MPEKYSIDLFASKKKTSLFDPGGGTGQAYKSYYKIPDYLKPIAALEKEQAAQEDVFFSRPRGSVTDLPY